MALPKIETPTYRMDVPSTKKSVEYRPFLVKEEKILLTALEGDEGTSEALMAEITMKIIDTCTFGKLKMDELTMFDIEYLFLNIRSKSRGEIITPRYACVNVIDGERCNEINEVMVDLNTVKVEFPKEDYSKVLLDGDVGIQFKYTTAETLTMIEGEDDVVKKMFMTIVDSIDFIFDAETIYKSSETTKIELVDFIENLNEKQFSEVRKFFDNQPKLKHSTGYKCSKCGYTEDIIFTGLESFFV